MEFHDRSIFSEQAFNDVRMLKNKLNSRNGTIIAAYYNYVLAKLYYGALERIDDGREERYKHQYAAGEFETHIFNALNVNSREVAVSNLLGAYHLWEKKDFLYAYKVIQSADQFDIISIEPNEYDYILFKDRLFYESEKLVLLGIVDIMMDRKEIGLKKCEEGLSEKYYSCLPIPPTLPIRILFNKCNLDSSDINKMKSLFKRFSYFG